jgi:hydrogenase small subunit
MAGRFPGMLDQIYLRLVRAIFEGMEGVMEVTRRDFLKYVSASAITLGLSGLQLSKVEQALASASSPPVIWLVGGACSGCSVSFMNAVNPPVEQVLLNSISLKYHPTLMAAAGDLAVSAATSAANQGGYILVVEGAIPTGASGQYCYVWDEGGVSVTMADAVGRLAANARYVAAVGTCAAFGGIPSRVCDTGVQPLGAFLGRTVVNLPGCPAHPDWVIGSLASLIGGTVPALDGNGRPTAYYRSQVIHDRCPRREAYHATQFGQAGRCLGLLGCKGRRAHADCDVRQWNNAQNWCIGVDGLCIGCTETDYPAFPLHSGGVGDAACVLAGAAPPPPRTDLNNHIYLPYIGQSRTGGS